MDFCVCLSGFILPARHGAITASFSERGSVAGHRGLPNKTPPKFRQIRCFTVAKCDAAKIDIYADHGVAPRHDPTMNHALE